MLVFFRLLNTLTLFGERIELDEATNNVTFTEDNFQLQVEEVDITSYSEQTYTSQLSNLAMFQENVVRTPLQETSIRLPNSLASDLIVQGAIEGNETLRVTSFVMLRSSLFVLNSTSDLAVDLAEGALTLSNLIVAATLSTLSRVEDLTEPILIRFVETEVGATLIDPHIYDYYSQHTHMHTYTHLCTCPCTHTHTSIHNVDTGI